MVEEVLSIQAAPSLKVSDGLAQGFPPFSDKNTVIATFIVKREVDVDLFIAATSGSVGACNQRYVQDKLHVVAISSDIRLDKIPTLSATGGQNRGLTFKQNVPTLGADLRKGVGVLVLKVWDFISVPGITHKTKLIAVANVEELTIKISPVMSRSGTLLKKKEKCVRTEPVVL